MVFRLEHGCFLFIFLNWIVFFLNALFIYFFLRFLSTLFFIIRRARIISDWYNNNSSLLFVLRLQLHMHRK